jgi:hypothetical protein
MTARRLLAAAAALLLLPACKDSTAPDPGLPGMYTLRTIAGKPLPWPQFPSSDGDTAWVLGGTYTFRADDTFTVTNDYRYVRHGIVELRHTENDGEYRVIGDSVRMWQTAFDYGARRGGKTLTVHGPSEDWVYRRLQFPE